MSRSTQTVSSDASGLVLFSRGQDSATCLAWALQTYDRVETVGFDYGQRHSVELVQREHVIAELRKTFPTLGSKLGADTMLEIPTINAIGTTAMTSDVEIEMGADGPSCS